MSKPVLSAKRRRKGFESVRKGSCPADARLIFFENEQVYCKLTAASTIQKGLLHVSFGAVRSGCCGVLKKAFLFRLALHELKKFVFFANQKFSIYRKFYALPSKASRFHNQNIALLTTFYCPQKPPFYVQKPFFCTSLPLRVSKTTHFHKPKAVLSHKPFLVAIQSNPFPPSTSHSRHP